MHCLVGQLVDVRPVLEVIVTLRHAGCAPEVVERNRGDPALGESQRNLLVEAVEPADVGENHDSLRGRLVGNSRECRERVPVRRSEDELIM